MVHACQKTGKCASSKIKKIADNIDKKSAEDFARTKHKGLPEIKKKKKKKKFKEWIKNNHPEFEIKENILLGMAAAVQTAAQRLRGQKYGNRTANEINDGSKTKNYVEAFLSQNWDWAKILNEKIINLIYWYKTETEELNEDDFYPVNVLDLPRVGKKASYINKITKNKAPINKGIEYLKNSNYWDDSKINKFYKAIEKINKSPEHFGGKDIRKTS